MLTAMSIAWFQKNHLPNPSAIGVLCASVGDLGGGDASFIAGPLNGFSIPAGTRRVRRPAQSGGVTYLSNVDPKDPLAYPINSAKLVAKVSAHLARDEHSGNGIQLCYQFTQRISEGRS